MIFYVPTNKNKSLLLNTFENFNETFKSQLSDASSFPLKFSSQLKLLVKFLLQPVFLMNES